MDISILVKETPQDFFFLFFFLLFSSLHKKSARPLPQLCKFKCTLYGAYYDLHLRNAHSILQTFIAKKLKLVVSACMRILHVYMYCNQPFGWPLKSFFFGTWPKNVSYLASLYRKDCPCILEGRLVHKTYIECTLHLPNKVQYPIYMFTSTL